MDVNVRIAQLIKLVYGNQANAARALKVSRQRINAVVGGLKPGLDFYTQLAENIERLNINWLMRGEGPMFVDWGSVAESDTTLLISPKDKMLERIINIWDAERKQWESMKRENTEILMQIKINQDLLLEEIKKIKEGK
jgi:hypothetical protein